MTRRLLGWGLALAMAAGLLGAPASAGGYEIYVNNKPFKGKSAGKPADLTLEAEPYFKLAGGEFSYDPEDGQALLSGSPVAVTLIGGVPYVRARELVSQVGGRYLVNQDMGTVDIYAFDPVEAARKAWERIFSQPAILSQEDLNIMTSLARAVVTRDLEMELDFDVQVLLAPPELMRAASGQPDLALFTSCTRRAGVAAGISQGRVMVKAGLPPVVAMTFVGVGLSELWASQLGLKVEGDLVGGFGLWTGYLICTSMGAPLSPADFMAGQPPGERAEFQRLLRMQETGGPLGVMQYMKNLQR